MSAAQNIGTARCPSAEQRAELYRETCTRLIDFVRTFWSIVEPAQPLVEGPHVAAVCAYLEAWRRREFARGVITMPPGTGKSLLVDVFYPAWVWTTEPGYKSLACSYDIGLCLRDSYKIRTIVQSPEYQNAWPRTRLAKDKRALGELWTTMGGYRFSTTPDAEGGTGRHFNDVSVNDPVKPQAVLGPELGQGLEHAERWWTGVMPTRRSNPDTFGVMITAQRLVAGDLPGKALDTGRYTHLCLPMRYEPRAHWIIGDWSRKLDRRTLPGELLHPARYSAVTVAEMENDLGANASAQLQQNPIPRTGGLLEEQHLRYEWIEPPKNGYWIQTWDFSAKGEQAVHSAVHGALWCSGECTRVAELTNSLADRDRGEQPQRSFITVPNATRYFLIDEVWGVWTVPESERQFELTQALPMWDQAAARVIEAKAAGIGVIQRYSSRFPGIVAFHEINDDCKALATLSKIDRHRANLAEYHAGRVLLPPWKAMVPDATDPRDGPGPDSFRRELLSFPRGARDDRVDTSSMALARLTQGVSVYYAAVRELAKQAASNDDWG
jgi:phage terminase large subunit-like protein